jgi:hypothetical protein
MHRDVMLMMSGASVASFLEGKGDGSGIRRAKPAATSRDRDRAGSGVTRATPSRVVAESNRCLAVTEAG